MLVCFGFMSLSVALYGSAGIPAAFIVSYMFQACALLIRLHARIELRWTLILRQAVRILVPAAVLAAILLAIHSTVSISRIESWAVRFGILTVMSAGLGTLYLLLSFAMKVTVASELLERGRTLIGFIRRGRP